MNKFVVALLAVCGCIDSGVDTFDVPLALQSKPLTLPLEAADGWQITALQARVVVGPLYLCSGATAGALCDTAVAEWLDAESLTLVPTTPEANPSLILHARTGMARSFMYDHGIVSRLTEDEPLTLPAAAALGNHSLVASGTATNGTTVLPFSLSLAVFQGQEVEQGVPVVRSPTNNNFAHDFTGQEELVTVTFDSADLFGSMSFDAFVEDAACVAGGPGQVCAGATALTCDEDGNTLSSADCASQQAVCVPRLGCQAEVIVPENSSAARSVNNRLVAGTRANISVE